MFMEWHGKLAAVVGLGLSNTALIRYIVGKGGEVIACDRKTREELGYTYEALAAMGVSFNLGETYLNNLDHADIVFVTPGMRRDLPELQQLRHHGIPISSEMDLFFDLCRARTIGITGSSGKTTTTTLIGEILTAAGYDVVVGGNIGQPLIEQAENLTAEQWAVVELSSFQLESMRHSPDIALVTNVSPNHLDIHGTMTAYVTAKKNIYRFQDDNDWLVINDNDHWADEMELEASASVRRFSHRGPVGQGAYIDRDRIVLARSTQRRRTLEQVCHVSDVRLLGEHNLENVLAAVTVADLAGVRLTTVRDVIASFTGVPHRLELVRDVWGVKYYNDSIATTPARTIAALKSFNQPIVLIVGGYDKGLPFDELAATIQQRQVKTVIAVGDTADDMIEAVKAVKNTQWSYPLVVRADSFEAAVVKAHTHAVSGDIVLLSPACASYGMFNNFEERGARFRQLVHDLTEQAIMPEPRHVE